MTELTRKQIEKSFKRILGPDPEQRKRIEEVNAAADWTIRCWNCKNYTTMKRPLEGPCPHCGAELSKRS
jgi:hypothetical protein